MEEERRQQPDRRRIDEITEDFRHSVINQLEQGDQRMNDMASALQANTEAMMSLQAEVKQLRENQGSAVELLEFFESVKGAFRVFDAIGKLAKPVGAIAFALSACWGLWLAIKAGLHIK